MGEPFRRGAAGCGGFASTTYGAPTSCAREPVAVGLVISTSLPRRVWVEFACAEHVGALTAPRRLSERDHTELQRRRGEALRVARKQPPYALHRPLAEGVAAHELAVRARAWAATHPFTAS